MVLQHGYQVIDVKAPPIVSLSIVASHGERRASTTILKLAEGGKAPALMKMPAKICFRNSFTVVLSGTSNTLYANTCHDISQPKNAACRAAGEIQTVSLKSDMDFGGLGDGSEDQKSNGSNL